MGSGINKFKDCIGIDRIRYEMTDIVHDYNLPIPLKNDTVDFIMCSHSLQYVDNLILVMKDIYRICRHKAIVCIVAPYAHASVHMVNPQFKQQFNEHSPKYWTTYPGRMEDDSELSLYPSVAFPVEEDLSQNRIDFRMLKMEFFYFPAYHGLYNEVELGLLRQSQFNVAHQIMYHLLVVKEPMPEAEIAGLQGTVRLEEPDYVMEQRIRTTEKEEQEQSFNLDHFRSLSSGEEESLNKSVEEKPPILKKSSKGGKPKSSRTKTRAKSNRKTSLGKKKVGTKR